MKNIKRVNILGCPFDAISFPEAVERIEQCVLANARMQVVPGSIDFVMKAKRDKIFARELWRADLVVADGLPITWAASMLGDPISGRVSGTELVWYCAKISARIRCPVAMIGGKFGLTVRAAQKMADRYPGARLHPLPTPFPLTPEANIELVKAIKATGAKILLVALGAPRQERWVQANLAECRANVGIGIGSAFDIISGKMPRAPQWMQDLGFEWFYRLWLEPKRLGRRYLIEDTPFIWHLANSLIQNNVNVRRAR
jgi:N-acetylglucosaminyldiphosphoundecaprenol N-acetyl-beta-D-mannosaminyltransferase